MVFDPTLIDYLYWFVSAFSASSVRRWVGDSESQCHSSFTPGNGLIPSLFGMTGLSGNQGKAISFDKSVSNSITFEITTMSLTLYSM